MRDVTLVVLAKAPVAGRSKTRCTPPCTPLQAAQLAEAALADTLDAVLAAPAARRVLVLDGAPGPWLPAGIEVIAQRGDGLDERLAAAFDDVGGPAVLVGMDTPQVTPALLAHAAAALAGDGTDAVLGRSSDGGYWAIGLRHPEPGLFVGVAMSTDHTARDQLARLDQHGLAVRLLPELTDVDTFADASTVADLASGRRFPDSVARIRASLRRRPGAEPATTAVR